MSAKIIGVSLLLAGCMPDLPIPAGTEISCGTDTACPEGWRCDRDRGLCLRGLAPAVSIGAITRTIAEVVIPITLSAVGDDDVAFAATLNWNDTSYAIEVTARPADDRGQVGVGAEGGGDVALGRGGDGDGDGDGDRLELVWDAPTFFAEHDRPGSPLVRDLRVEVTPSDANGSGSAATSDSFLFGNDPPAIIDLNLHGLRAGEAAGEVALSFAVNDSSGDDVVLDRFELLLPSGGWETEEVDVEIDADIEAMGDPTRSADLGGSVALDEEPAGEPAVLVQALLWDSVPTLPGRTPGLRIRFSVADAYGGRSAPIESAPFTVDNAPTAALKVAATAAGRATQSVELSATLTDPNPGQSIDLTVQFSVGGSSPRHDLSFVLPGLTDPTDLVASPTGSVYGLTWNALADVGAGLGLTTASFDTDGDGIGETIGLAYAADVRLWSFAVDSAGGSRPPGMSASLALGNDPPAVQLSDLAAILPTPLGGAVPVELRLLDSAGDPVDLQIEFRSGPTDPWRTPALLLGATEALASDPAGSVHVVVWDSAAPPAPHPAVPQGLGAGTFDTVELRARGLDHPAEATTHFGPWAMRSLPSVVN